MREINEALREAVAVEELRASLADAMARAISPYVDHIARKPTESHLQVGCWIARRQIDAVMDALARAGVDRRVTPLTVRIAKVQ